MGTPSNKGYKRSWKNLLINKRYQLRFTLFMVGVSTILMLGLGYWVLREAADTTQITRRKIEDRPCEPKAAAQPSAAPDTSTTPASGPTAPTGAAGTIPGTSGAGAPSPESDSAAADPDTTPTSADAPVSEPPKLDTDAPDDSATATADSASEGEDDAAPDTAGDASERPPREIKVELGEMKIDSTVLASETNDAAPALTPVDLARCRKEKASQLAQLDAGYTRIQVVLVVIGLLLVMGLTIFGIKMTHKVAGPLYKVTLYFDKMRNGTFDQVYSLRKGDQLIEFYEQFKAAHAGLRAMEKADIDVLREVLDAADEADLAARSPELATLIDELRQTLERKQKSLE